MLRFALWLFAILVLLRIVLELVQSFAPRWRPRGPMALVAEVIYTPTDPPLKVLRKVLPTIPIGEARLDLSPMVLLLVVSLLSSLLSV